jgi:hypothetical protein
MKARGALLNGKTVKGNGSGTVVNREMQNNSEVVLEACKCVGRTNLVAA